MTSSLLLAAANVFNEFDRPTGRNLDGTYMRGFYPEWVLPVSLVGIVVTALALGAVFRFLWYACGARWRDRGPGRPPGWGFVGGTLYMACLWLAIVILTAEAGPIGCFLNDNGMFRWMAVGGLVLAPFGAAVVDETCGTPSWWP